MMPMVATLLSRKMATLYVITSTIVTTWKTISTIIPGLKEQVVAAIILVLCIVAKMGRSDSMSYHDELYKLDSYSNEKEFDEIHESRMDYISLRSHRFIIAKFIILLLSAIFFAFG